MLQITTRTRHTSLPRILSPATNALTEHSLVSRCPPPSLDYKNRFHLFSQTRRYASKTVLLSYGSASPIRRSRANPPFSPPLYDRPSLLLRYRASCFLLQLPRRWITCPTNEDALRLKEFCVCRVGSRTDVNSSYACKI